MNQQGGERARTTMVGRVLVVSVVGVLSASAIRRIREQVWPLPHGALAIITDFRRALIAVTEAEMVALTRHKQGEVFLPPPLAWVLPDGVDLTPWRRQVLRLATLGVLRYATGDFEDAMSWAAAQAIREQRQAPPIATPDCRLLPGWQTSGTSQKPVDAEPSS